MSESITPKIAGLRYKVIVNGKRALNGERYGATFPGTVRNSEPGVTIYDVVRELVAHIEELNSDMGLPDSIQITIQ